MTPGGMTRYSCQLALPGFGAEAQQKLQQAHVLVVGMGGLGCPAALYLASAGVGTLGIADDDVINTSNLHRQVLYGESETGQKKVLVAQGKLQAQNPGIRVVAYNERITAENVFQIISGYDIVVDATDNFTTHYLLNDACVIAGKPMVQGAIYQYEGHAAVWNMPNADGTRSPNYRDVFPEVNALQIPDCTEGGVLPTIAGIIGCTQANEAIKVIAGVGETLAGKMMIFDALTAQSHVINIGPVTKTKITALTPFSFIPSVTKTELAEVLRTNSSIVIDVRTIEEHAECNIGGTNIPLSELENNLEIIKANDSVIFYCASGKRSMQAAQWLKSKLPAMRIASLEGGIQATGAH